MDVIVSMTLPDAETQALLSQAQSKARQLRSLLALPVVQQRSQDQLLEENKSLRKSLQHTQQRLAECTEALEKANLSIVSKTEVPGEETEQQEMQKENELLVALLAEKESSLAEMNSLSEMALQKTRKELASAQRRERKMKDHEILITHGYRKAKKEAEHLRKSLTELKRENAMLRIRLRRVEQGDGFEVEGSQKMVGSEPLASGGSILSGLMSAVSLPFARGDSKSERLHLSKNDALASMTNETNMVWSEQTKKWKRNRKPISRSNSERR